MCMSKEDCKSANVTCASHSDPANQGHMMQEEVHCFDAACVCMPAPNQGNPTIHSSYCDYALTDLHNRQHV